MIERRTNSSSDLARWSIVALLMAVLCVACGGTAPTPGTSSSAPVPGPDLCAAYAELKADQSEIETVVDAIKSGDTSASETVGTRVASSLEPFLKLDPLTRAGTSQAALANLVAPADLEIVVGAGEAGEASLQADPAGARANALQSLEQGQADWSSAIVENARLASSGEPHC